MYLFSWAQRVALLPNFTFSILFSLISHYIANAVANQALHCRNDGKPPFVMTLAILMTNTSTFDLCCSILAIIYTFEQDLFKVKFLLIGCSNFIWYHCIQCEWFLLTHYCRDTLLGTFFFKTSWNWSWGTWSWLQLVCLSSITLS